MRGRFRLTLAAMLAAMTMTGCALAPVAAEIAYQKLPVYPPKALMSKIDVAPPPAKDQYLAASCSAREGMLFDLIMDYMGSLNQANVQFGKLQEWTVEQQKLYPSANPPLKE